MFNYNSLKNQDTQGGETTPCSQATLSAVVPIFKAQKKRGGNRRQTVKQHSKKWILIGLKVQAEKLKICLDF